MDVLVSLRQRGPRSEETESPAVVPDQRSTTEVASATIGGPTWHAQAEESLRDAARKLEVLGVTDPEAARLAGVVFRLAGRVRSDRTVAR